MMEVTQEMINALLRLEDKELKEKFVQIAAAMGMNERMAAANTAKFRSLLKDSDPKALSALLAGLGEEKAGEILRTAGGEKS